MYTLLTDDLGTLTWDEWKSIYTLCGSCLVDGRTSGFDISKWVNIGHSIEFERNSDYIRVGHRIFYNIRKYGPRRACSVCRGWRYIERNGYDAPLSGFGEGFDEFGRYIKDIRRD